MNSLFLRHCVLYFGGSYLYTAVPILTPPILAGSNIFATHSWGIYLIAPTNHMRPRIAMISIIARAICSRNPSICAVDLWLKLFYKKIFAHTDSRHYRFDHIEWKSNMVRATQYFRFRAPYSIYNRMQYISWYKHFRIFATSFLLYLWN